MIERNRQIAGDQLDILEDRLKAGDTIQEIAEEWSVTIKAVYYWCSKLGINLKAIKRQREDAQQEHPEWDYAYYIKQQQKKGKITQKQKRKIIRQFNERKPYDWLGESHLDEYSKDE